MLNRRAHHSFRPTQMANPRQDTPECKVAVGAGSLVTRGFYKWR